MDHDRSILPNDLSNTALDEKYMMGVIRRTNGNGSCIIPRRCKEFEFAPLVSQYLLPYDHHPVPSRRGPPILNREPPVDLVLDGSHGLANQ